MARIQEILLGRNEKININTIIETNPWIVNENMKCILSPDSDGLLCGLFMSHFFNWDIIGYYDGKVLLLKDGISCTDDDVCFLDMEIWREKIKSIGHHMVVFNKQRLPQNFYKGYTNCIQPNLLRNYDGNSEFRLKYPLATIHFLISLLHLERDINLPLTSICPLLFTDGTYKVLFSYPENVLNWLEYLDVTLSSTNPLKSIFLNEHYTIHGIMQDMDDFFRKRDEISISNERGDRLRISNSDGTPVNINKIGSTYNIDASAKDRITEFLTLLSVNTEWDFDVSKWTFNNLNLHIFVKGDYSNRNWRMNISNFNQLLLENPISWAMTSGNNIEFTLDPNKSLG